MIVFAATLAILQSSAPEANLREGSFANPDLIIFYPEYIAPMVRQYRDCLNSSHSVTEPGLGYEGAMRKLTKACAPLRSSALAARRAQGIDAEETEADMAGVFDRLQSNALRFPQSADLMIAGKAVPPAR